MRVFPLCSGVGAAVDSARNACRLAHKFVKSVPLLWWTSQTVGFTLDKVFFPLTCTCLYYLESVPEQCMYLFCGIILVKLAACVIQCTTIGFVKWKNLPPLIPL